MTTNKLQEGRRVCLVALFHVAVSCFVTKIFFTPILSSIYFVVLYERVNSALLLQETVRQQLAINSCNEQSEKKSRT